MIMLKTLFLVFTTVYTFLNSNIYHAGKSQDYDLFFTLEVLLVKKPLPHHQTTKQMPWSGRSKGPVLEGAKVLSSSLSFGLHKNN